MDADLRFAGDHETGRCILFVVPSGCWHIGSGRFGLLFHVIKQLHKVMLTCFASVPAELDK